ncbi:hypothetical protein D3C76_1746310 [compost metagenome]
MELQGNTNHGGPGVFLGVVQKLLHHTEYMLFHLQIQIFDGLDFRGHEVDPEFAGRPFHLKQLAQSGHQPDITQ